MPVSSPRRLVVALAAVGVMALAAAGGAGAAPATMPAANPIDYAQLNKTATAQVFTYTVKGEDFEGDAMSDAVNNDLMGGMGATITVSKAVVKGYTTYQTVTVRPTKVGQVTSMVSSAFATLSGGNYGSGVITSTRLTKNGGAFIVKLSFDEQGENPDLNLRFFLYHS